MGARDLLVAAFVFTAATVAGAQVHHVVGEDRGWDPSSDVASWSSQRVFRVGDKICELLLLSPSLLFHRIVPVSS